MKLFTKRNKINYNDRLLFNKKIILLGMLPGLVLYIGFFVLPSFLTFIFSFTDISTVVGQKISFIGLENYKEVLFKNNSRDLMVTFLNTLKFSFFTTVIQTVIALVFAVALCKKFVKGKKFYRGIIFLPTILGMTVTGLCFKLFFSNDGIASSVLDIFGAKSAFFADYNNALKLVIFCQIWASVGYEMMLFIAALQNIPEDYREAASIDGASENRTFWSIILPQLWPTVVVNVLICIIGSLSAFQIILVTTGGTAPTRTLSMFIYQIAFGMGNNGSNTTNIGRQGLAAAMQVLLFLIIFIATIITRVIMSKVQEEE